MACAKWLAPAMAAIALGLAAVPAQSAPLGPMNAVTSAATNDVHAAYYRHRYYGYYYPRYYGYYGYNNEYPRYRRYYYYGGRRHHRRFSPL